MTTSIKACCDFCEYGDICDCKSIFEACTNKPLVEAIKKFMEKYSLYNLNIRQIRRIAQSVKEGIY